MQKRQIKKMTGGKWQKIKWSEVKKGDTLRIYERGYGFSDGRSNTFVATSDAKKIEGNWGFEYEHGDLNDAALINVHDNVRKGNPKTST
jgi:hypothetical protein